MRYSSNNSVKQTAGEISHTGRHGSLYPTDIARTIPSRIGPTMGSSTARPVDTVAVEPTSADTPKRSVLVERTVQTDAELAQATTQTTPTVCIYYTSYLLIHWVVFR